ncbi:hypothetical protein PINS_up007775 [Pythium insidiosum]|nr:hypothetical protein PINS_up007775 [Pythium insidiosum]
MPKGPALSTAEREQILALRAENASARQIAEKLQRSKTVVLNFLRDPAQYGQIKRPGRRRRLSPEQEQQLFAALAAADDSKSDGDHAVGKKSADQIRRELHLPLSARRIQQLLSQWRRDMRRATDQRHGLSDRERGERERGLGLQATEHECKNVATSVPEAMVTSPPEVVEMLPTSQSDAPTTSSRDVVPPSSGHSSAAVATV